MAESNVEGGCGSLEEVGEETGVDVGLFVQKVEFTSICLLCGEVVGENFSFETLGQVVFKLKLCVKAVGCGPGLGKGQACSWG